MSEELLSNDRRVEERKREKVTWEVKECSRRKAQKANTFTIIAMNFVQEQLKTDNIFYFTNRQGGSVMCNGT